MLPGIILVGSNQTKGERSNIQISGSKKKTAVTPLLITFLVALFAPLVPFLIALFTPLFALLVTLLAARCALFVTAAVVVIIPVALAALSDGTCGT
jgi:hypothetical protein